MTLMSETIGSGPTRRCDAKCYNAKSGDCTCICGGKNHAVGLQKASENVQQIFLPMLEERTGLKIAELDPATLEPMPRYREIGRLF